MKKRDWCDVLSVAEMLQAYRGTFSTLCQAVIQAGFSQQLLCLLTLNFIVCIHMKYAVQIAHVFIRKSSQPVKLMMKLIWDSSLRHYFTYQGQTYCVNLVDIKSHENVGDMQMFLLMGREDIFQAYVFNMLCVQLHMMLQSPWAPQSALCVVHRPTICPPFYPSLAF